MSRRFYQYCGLARALELVGERWAFLVVRDLVLGPKRLEELHDSLPRIPASLLLARLNELEEAGVVHRVVLGHLDAAIVYELTEYGSELEDAVLVLGRWGARSLGAPDPSDVTGLDSAILALYATFRPERARGVRVSFELDHGPGMRMHAIVDDGVLKVCAGRFPDADLTLRTAGSLRPLMAGEVSAAEVVANGVVRLTGDQRLLELFVELFHIAPAPQRAAGLALR